MSKVTSPIFATRTVSDDVVRRNGGEIILENNGDITFRFPSVQIDVKAMYDDLISKGLTDVQTNVTLETFLNAINDFSFLNAIK